MFEAGNSVNLAVTAVVGQHSRGNSEFWALIFNLSTSLLTKAADPEDEPPAILVLLCGFTTGPVAAVKLPPSQHKFSQTALPTICPPASNIRDTTVASISGTKPSNIREPFIMGTPATHVLSLMATVLPFSLPLAAPLMSQHQYLINNTVKIKVELASSKENLVSPPIYTSSWTSTRLDRLIHEVILPE